MKILGDGKVIIQKDIIKLLDLLSSTAVAQRKRSFELLINTYNREAAIRDILNEYIDNIDKVYVLGGSSALEDIILYYVGISIIQ